MDDLAIANTFINDIEAITNFLWSMSIILCKHNNAQIKTIDTLANTIKLLQKEELKRHNDNPNAPSVAPLLWPSVRVKPNTWKSRELESSGTPECSELDSKGQNTSHWGVLGVIGKVLKRKYRKWPCIGHLDICSPSYGQKKGGNQIGSLTPDH